MTVGKVTPFSICNGKIVYEDCNQLLQNAVRLPETYRRLAELSPQAHAKKLDKRLGYKISKIEVKLLQKYKAYDLPEIEESNKQHYKGTQAWIGLHPQALQTPYNDLYEALNILKDYNVEKIVDIGAGYGRVGIVKNAVFPKSQFVGYEILKQRQREGNRIFDKLNLLNSKILLEDVLEEEFDLPRADIYFMYDFSEVADLTQILDTLYSRKNDYQFFLITKGERLDFLIEKRYKEFWQANNFIEVGSLKIYSSKIDLTELRKGVCNGNR